MLSPLPKSQSPTVTQTCIFIFSNSYDRELFSENGLLLDNEFLPGISYSILNTPAGKIAHGVMMDVFFGSGFGQPYGSEFMT
ncbi:17713_t:CDS:2, partial [Funneliformis geosporum]